MNFTDWQLFKDHLKAQLKSELPGLQSHKRMMSAQHKGILRMKAGENARKAAVLILLFPEGGQVKTILIERASYNGMHSKQVAFPGGKMEDTDNDLIMTALREAYEEIGLDAKDVDVAGFISPVFVYVSNFLVQPVIAFMDKIGEFKPCEREVERILPVSLSDIFENLGESEVGSAIDATMRWISPAFIVHENIIVWGATGMIIAELEDVLKNIL